MVGNHRVAGAPKAPYSTPILARFFHTQSAGAGRSLQNSAGQVRLLHCVPFYYYYYYF